MKEAIKVFLSADKFEGTMTPKVDIIDFEMTFIRGLTGAVLHDIYVDWGISCRCKMTYGPGDVVTIVISKAGLLRKKAIKNQLSSTALAIWKYLEKHHYKVGIF